MRVITYKRLLKTVGFGIIGIGTLSSLRANEYDLGSIGVVRLGRAAATVFTIGKHYQQELYQAKVDPNSEEYEQLKSKAHEFGAQKLLELCCANKGVYIKVGQHIGALDYLLPPEYVRTMRILHSSAPQSSLSDVLTVLKEDLKKDPSEVFESIEPKPLGAASLAQVHRATLKDGTVVAVKVQHRSVKNNSYVDIKSMSALVKLTSFVFPDFKFEWLVDETKKNIPQELDFYQEGKNAEKVQSMFSGYHWLKVPKIYWDLTTPRVLTMEYVEGGQANDLQYLRKNNLNPYEVSSKLGRLYSHMIFIHGFVHSDPHPGNVLVRNVDGSAEIVLLDHGLYANLSDNFRWEYSKLWLAILDSNKEAMQRHATNLGVGDLYGLLSCMVAGRTWDTIMTGMRKKKYDSTERQVFQKQVPNILPKITEVLERVNRQMLLVLKTNDLIRSIDYCLNTHTRMTGTMEMTKCCVESAYGEKLKNCHNTWGRIKISLSKELSLLKLNLYYVYLGLLHFNLNESIQSLLNEEFYAF